MDYQCSNQETSVSLILKENEPVAISVDPFGSSKQIHLSITEKNNINILCCHLHQEAESFTIPRYVTSLAAVPPQSYFILTYDSFTYTVYFCLSHQDVNASLQGSEEGLILNLTSGTSADSQKIRTVFLSLKGKKLHEIVHNMMELALSYTGGIGKLLENKLPPPRWLDGMGWESGIALGSHVSHEKIVDSVDSLVKAGYPPSFVLIDEGWQQLEWLEQDPGNKLALVNFEADSQRFPYGLKGVVKDLQMFGIKHIGVWHAMMGSRGGIHSRLAKSYDLPRNAEGYYFLGYDLGRTFQFFYDYYGYLREQGIDFIKVGDQSSVNRYCPLQMEATVLYKNLQSAMQAAASIQFNSAHFNTECLRNENLFYWGNSRIARTAEDIDVSNPLGMMRAIRNNLTNSLWVQHLMQPDFDAWLTYTEQSETLAIFHALSGSINVIGDLAGKHNKALINKFVLPSGYLLKADRPLTLCRDSIFSNPIEEKKIYKAYTFKGDHGVVGAFNLTSGKHTLHGTISPGDVEGLQGDIFALFSHHNGFIKTLSADETTSITLKPNQSDVLIFAPIHHGIAVLGGYSFFLAPSPLLEVYVEEDSMHILSLVGTGILIYCERQILEVRRNGKTVPWDYDGNRHTLLIDSRASLIEEQALYTIAFEA